jgi:protein kinase C substrate 80K-H
LFITFKILEPSAFPNGHFHCLNIGHRGLDVPSSIANDFICGMFLDIAYFKVNSTSADCCDGSDGWDSGVECPNVCSELGQKTRKDAQKYRATVEVGFKQRQELSKQGGKQITEMKTNIGDLKKQLDGLQPSKDEAEKKKNEVEEGERATKDKHGRYIYRICII